VSEVEAQDGAEFVIDSGFKGHSFFGEPDNGTVSVDEAVGFFGFDSFVEAFGRIGIGQFDCSDSSHKKLLIFSGHLCQGGREKRYKIPAELW